MPDIATRKPSLTRLVRTLIGLGLTEEVAYDLKEDARAMFKGELTEMLEDLTRSLTATAEAQTDTITTFKGFVEGKISNQSERISNLSEKISNQSERIDDLRDHITAQFKAQNAQIETLNRGMVSLSDNLNALRIQVTGPYERLASQLLRMMWIIIGAGLLGVLALVANQVRALLGL